MKTLRSTSLGFFLLLALGLCSTKSLTCQAGDFYSNDEPVGEAAEWPEGLKDLANAFTRVHAFYINELDVFFFTGNSREFSDFLRDYAAITPIVGHKLVTHPGQGLAKSLWTKGKKIPCDWKLVGYPATWLDKTSKSKDYILEVHVWPAGKIDMAQVTIPDNVSVVESQEASDRVVDF